MANLRLQPPEGFNFRNPDDWPKWKRRFEQFRSASGLVNESEQRQVSTLLYCMGEEADEVLTSTDASAEDRSNYSAVVSKFDGFFRVRKNVIFERARFNRRCQLEGESVDEYITSLYTLVESCDYGPLRDEMLRDRIVVGIRDAAMSEKLQLDPELTLEKTKRLVRQKEAVHEQHRELHTGATGASKNVPIVIAEVKNRRCRERGVQNRRLQCTRCGLERHSLDKCPASNATYHKCGRRGHYSNVCFSKTVKAGHSTDAVTAESGILDSAFLGAVTPLGQKRSWSIELNLNGKKMTFKLDTGAEVTAISEDSLGKLDISLQKPAKLLYGPTSQALNVIGQFFATLKSNERECKQLIFVVRGLKNNLLGLPAITALQLFDGINTSQINTCDTASAVFAKYPEIFNGLGNMGEPYGIKLKENAVPYSLFLNVPIPLRGKVQEELVHMESYQE